MRYRTACILVCFALTPGAIAAEGALQRPAQLLEAGRPREAAALLIPLVEQDPQNAEAHQLLGDAYRQEGNGPAAEQEYRRAIALGRRDPELLKSLATVEKWNRHFRDARASYRQELQIAPKDREARDEFNALRLQRGISVFGAYGGWETDSTAKGWQGEIGYRGLDRIDAYFGASYADKFFYNRRSYYGKAYAFFSPTGYVKASFEQQNYQYPVAKTPIPDANAYLQVPSAEVEVGGNLGENLRASVGYEFFRPNFFFGPNDHANNHKVSTELSYHTAWRPLRLRLMSAVLRDPDPNHTLVDKVNQKVTVAYGLEYLIGGGADLSFRRLEAELLVLPDRDLDRSTDYSVLGDVTVPIVRRLKLKTGYVFDHYSSSSVFSGQKAQIYNVGFAWQVRRWLELSAGTKTIRRPIQDDQAVYVTTRFGLPIK